MEDWATTILLVVEDEVNGLTVDWWEGKGGVLIKGPGKGERSSEDSGVVASDEEA